VVEVDLSSTRWIGYGPLLQQKNNPIFFFDLEDVVIKLSLQS
jgi:hypothetical protein